MNKEIQALHDERMSLLKDTIRMKKTERVPSLCSGGSYPVYDSGYGWTEALHNWDIMKASILNFQKKYNFDLLCSTGTRNPLAIAEALGGSNYIINEEQYGLTYIDKHGMEADEYDELIKNPEKFTWENIVRRFYPNATKEMFAASLGEFMKFGQYAQEIAPILRDECGLPAYAKDVFSHPIETIFYTYRGIKGLSMDLHKIPEKVEAACKAMFERTDNLPSVIAKAEQGTSSEHVFDAMMAFLGHTVMKTSMYEKLYWPYVQKVIDYVVKYDKTLLLFFEGNNARLWHLFQDIPKGYVCVQIEQEDIFEAKKKIGSNICLAGGFPLQLLANGTKQQCLDYAKKLIDELAPGGGYMFRTDRGLTFKRDAKQENLMAVNEFALNYKFAVNYNI